MRTIAHQCPFSGGTSVYKARSILFSILPDEEYNDFEICAAEGLMRRAKSTNNILTITPNPANVYAAINYENDKDPIFKVEIFNSTGTLIKTLGNAKTISIIDLNSEIFIVKTTTTNGTVYNSKLIVIK